MDIFDFIEKLIQNTMKAIHIILIWGISFALFLVFIATPLAAIGVVSGVIFTFLTFYIEKHEDRLYREIRKERRK